MKQNNNRGYKLPLTKRKHRRTTRLSINSKDRSNKLADTIIRSKIFQPQAKYSLLSARIFRKHSNVKIDVNTCNKQNYEEVLRCKTDAKMATAMYD